MRCLFQRPSIVVDVEVEVDVIVDVDVCEKCGKRKAGFGVGSVLAVIDIGSGATES